MHFFQRRRMVFALLFVFIIAGLVLNWSHLINAMMPADSRPGPVPQISSLSTAAEFEIISAKLKADFPSLAGEFNHITIFQDSDLLAYEGPSTCLACHEKIKYTDQADQECSVDLMDNLTSSAHYRFFTKDHDNV